MAGPKFFIYGERRWREIDIDTGRVFGWGGVQFLSVHRGRLRVARKSAILRGLQNLTRNNPTSVRDSIPLSQIRKMQRKSKRNCKAIEDSHEYPWGCHQQHHCCCQRQNNNNFDKLLKASTNTASIQCNLAKPTPRVVLSSNITSNENRIDSNPLVLGYPKTYGKSTSVKRLSKRNRSASEDESRKRRRRSYISSDSESNNSISKRRGDAKSDIVENIKRNLSKTAKRKLSSEDEIIETASKKICNPTKFKGKKFKSSSQKSPKNKLKSARVISTNEDASINNNEVEKTNENSEKSRRKLRSSDKMFSDDEDVSPSIISKIANLHKTKERKRKDIFNKTIVKTSNKSRNDDNDLNSKFTRKIFNFSIDSDLESNISLPRGRVELHTRAQVHATSPKVKDANSQSKEKYPYKKTSKRKRVKSSEESVISDIRKSVRSGSREHFKELLIGEDDITLLRNFIESDRKNIFKVDLERFDSDDMYKTNIFYKINPIVCVDRSRTIRDMLRERQNESNAVSLEDFISNLGLRSVLDTSSQTSSKYKMRSRKKPEPITNEDKENKQSVNNRREVIKKVKAMSERFKKNSHDVNGEILEVSSDSDSNFKKSKKLSRERSKRPMPVIAVKRGLTKPRKGGRANREYSRAEDEAIVAWIRSGGRAGKVKGNQIWRELQPVYQQTAGVYRSWHSLRNRYLRYLLPTLGSLSLPPGEASRLRAAAAAGEIKSRKQLSNSILVQPSVKSAWSRRPRPPSLSSNSPPSRELSPPRKPSPPRVTSQPRASSNSSNYHTQSSDSDSESEDVPRKKSLINSASKENIKRSLRSSTIASTIDTEGHMPTYSELTKKYASKHDNDSDNSRRHSNRQTATAENKPRYRRLYNPKAT